MVQLTSCKVQIKMRVHRPLQQPIVSAGGERDSEPAGRGPERGEEEGRRGGGRSALRADQAQG